MASLLSAKISLGDNCWHISIRPRFHSDLLPGRYATRRIFTSAECYSGSAFRIILLKSIYYVFEEPALIEYRTIRLRKARSEESQSS